MKIKPRTLVYRNRISAATMLGCVVAIGMAILTVVLLGYEVYLMMAGR